MNNIRFGIMQTKWNKSLKTQSDCVNTCSGLIFNESFNLSEKMARNYQWRTKKT